MNLILVFKEDFIADQRVRLIGRRKDHITGILKAKPGGRLCVGLCGGLVGEGIVVGAGEDVVLDVHFNQQPPQPLPLTLILALPRPHAFKRALLCAASLGIKKIIILNFNRVDQSLWSSSSLRPQAVREQLVLGLEQSKDTVMPEVIFKERFKPFVEDELPLLIKGTCALLAHPGGSHPCPRGLRQPATLVIGPEGGVIDYEIAKLAGLGFQTINLGPRILRVESVLPYIIGKLF